MSNEAAQGANQIPPPDVAAVEYSLDHTRILLSRFHEEVGQLLAKVQRDVDTLSAALIGGPGAPRRADPGPAEEAPGERRLAEIVDHEQAVLRTRALINEVIDERFRHLSDLIQQAKARQSVSSLQKHRLGASHRKP